MPVVIAARTGAPTVSPPPLITPTVVPNEAGAISTVPVAALMLAPAVALSASVTSEMVPLFAAISEPVVAKLIALFAPTGWFRMKMLFALTVLLTFSVPALTSWKSPPVTAKDPRLATALLLPIRDTLPLTEPAVCRVVASIAPDAA